MSNRESQAARVAAMRHATKSVLVRGVAVDYLLGKAEFFGTKNDAYVRRLLGPGGGDVDMDALEATYRDLLDS